MTALQDSMSPFAQLLRPEVKADRKAATSNTGCFKKDTWICLDDFYEFDASELLQGSFSGRIQHIGELPSSMLPALISCALQSDDITGLQEQAIQN